MAQEYLTEASETPICVEPANAILEFYNEEKATREKQGLQTDLLGTKIRRDQGIIL